MKNRIIIIIPFLILTFVNSKLIARNLSLCETSGNKIEKKIENKGKDSLENIFKKKQIYQIINDSVNKNGSSPAVNLNIGKNPTKISTDQPKSKKSNFFNKQIWNLLWLLIGFLGSVYGSIIYQRWNRFRSNMRDIALERNHFEGIPIRPEDLESKLDKVKVYSNLIHRNFWSLSTDGHFEAAKKVYKLYSFSISLESQIKKMIGLKNKGNDVHKYLEAFKRECRKILDREFIQFENGIKPSLKALLTLKPHPNTMKKSVSPIVTYFDNLK